MIESHIDKQLEEKIDLYVNGQLSHEEIDELWAELIQDGRHLEYLKTVANTKALIESKRKEPTFVGFNQYWTYAAAAAVTLLIGVLTVLSYPSFQKDAVEPVSSIELDYYRSEDGVMASDKNHIILKNALALAVSGKMEEAITILEKELQTAEDPSWITELNLNIGSLYYNSEKYKEAAQSFEQVVKQEHIDVLTREKGYWYLGNAYFQLNQLDKAEAAILKAYDLNGAYRRVAGSYLDALSDR